MTKVKCPYSEDCCDIDTDKCASCLNNKKRSYYKPEEPINWRPYIVPYEPYPYIYPWVIGTGTTTRYDEFTTYDPSYATICDANSSLYVGTESHYVCAD